MSLSDPLLDFVVGLRSFGACLLDMLLGYAVNLCSWFGVLSSDLLLGCAVDLCSSFGVRFFGLSLGSFVELRICSAVLLFGPGSFLFYAGADV